jgi:hypothetical protein
MIDQKICSIIGKSEFIFALTKTTAIAYRSTNDGSLNRPMRRPVVALPPLRESYKHHNIVGRFLESLMYPAFTPGCNDPSRAWYNGKSREIQRVCFPFQPRNATHTRIYFATDKQSSERRIDPDAEQNDLVHRRFIARSGKHDKPVSNATMEKCKSGRWQTLQNRMHLFSWFHPSETSQLDELMNRLWNIFDYRLFQLIHQYHGHLSTDHSRFSQHLVHWNDADFSI